MKKRTKNSDVIVRVNGVASWKWQWPYREDLRAIRMDEMNVALLRKFLDHRHFIHTRLVESDDDGEQQKCWSRHELELLFTITSNMLRRRNKVVTSKAVIEFGRWEDVEEATQILNASLP
jgi:hypothetical protein